MKENEIDIISLISILIDKIKLIFFITIVFTIVGIVFSLLKPDIYKSHTTFYPHYESLEKTGGNLRNLAGLAGINLENEQSNTIPPSLYPKLISSTSFKQELLNEKINYNGEELLYRKYLLDNLNLFDIFLKPENDTTQNKIKIKDLIHTSPEDNFLFKILDKNIFIELNEKDGFINLGVYDKDPQVATRIAVSSNKILQKNIIEFKIKNINEIYKFTLNQLEIAKKNLYEIQDSLAIFRDSNKNIRSDVFLNQLNRIETEYNIRKNIYNELALTKEKTAIDVKRNTPIFTLINPASVPNEKSSPNRMFIILFCSFLGFIIGCFWVLIKNPLSDIISKTRNK